MLIGQYPAKINAKGQVALPAKFKAALGKKLIVSSGYERSLMLVAQKDWQAAADRINQGSTLGPTRETDRFLLGSAFEVEPDGQGRFVVPRYLRQFAGLVEAIVFVGVGNRAEVWSRPAWEKYSSLLTKKLSAPTSSFTSSH